jgi:hypothetical protein
MKKERKKERKRERERKACINEGRYIGKRKKTHV